MLAGKVIVITGAAQGMGRATAERCVQEGATVVLVDLDPAVEDVAQALGGQALVGDVTDAALAARAIESAGVVHGLVNVAGLHHQATAAEITDDDWARILAVNLTAQLIWARVAIPAMREGGSIVNIASIAGHHARPSAVASVTSKTGLLGLTRSIAVDFGRAGIRCNSISPGSIDTPMLQAYAQRDPAGMQAQTDRNYAGRVGRPDEIASACVYLLSDQAAFVNGIDLLVDGGAGGRHLRREMTYTTLELPRRDGTAWITLDRPDRLNALTGDMYLELERAAGECEADVDVGAIVLTGRGRAFCAGADLKSYTTEVDVSDPHSVRDRMRLIARVGRRWTNLDKPTIAAVNGAAVGGGANLALMCDLVLMRDDAFIAQNYAQKGLVPDMGGTYFLPRLVGRARATELALLGDRITAAEAERIGLVNRCIPAERWDDDVAAYARRVSATTARAAELILTGLRHSPTMDLDTMLEWEANAIAMILSTPEARAGFQPRELAR